MVDKFSKSPLLLQLFDSNARFPTRDFLVFLDIRKLRFVVFLLFWNWFERPVSTPPRSAFEMEKVDTRTRTVRSLKKSVWFFILFIRCNYVIDECNVTQGSGRWNFAVSMKPWIHKNGSKKWGNKERNKIWVMRERIIEVINPLFTMGIWLFHFHFKKQHSENGRNY